ncbi:MAG: hypothetical protein GXP16_09510 [Gammaproteobacteria bacterium]|nr:hypothetical protein [Gammaproteobacteria bacterium]
MTKLNQHKTNLPVAKGLAGVVVDSTAISNVRGRQGELSYRGVAIGELVNLPFHQVAGWVVSERLEDTFEGLLAASANLSEAETNLVLGIDPTVHPMRVLQCLIPVVSVGAEVGLAEVNQGIHIAAKLPAVVATHLRRKQVYLDPTRPYAERFLLAIGAGNNAQLIKAFEVAQILQLEHSFNAGTFASRVVASTLAPIASAIAAGIGALAGELHGGADQAVLDVADTLNNVDQAKSYVDHALANNIKVPGMGHREYRVKDPRAVYMFEWSKKLAIGTPHQQTFEILQAIELHFAQHMARVFGYVAHFVESRLDNRIFRPAAHYRGSHNRRLPSGFSTL